MHYLQEITDVKLPDTFYFISVKFRTGTKLKQIYAYKTRIRLKPHQKMIVLLHPQGFTNTPTRK